MVSEVAFLVLVFATVNKFFFFFFLSFSFASFSFIHTFQSASFCFCFFCVFFLFSFFAFLHICLYGFLNYTIYLKIAKYIGIHTNMMLLIWINFMLVMFWFRMLYAWININYQSYDWKLWQQEERHIALEKSFTVNVQIVRLFVSLINFINYEIFSYKYLSAMITKQQTLCRDALYFCNNYLG